MNDFAHKTIWITGASSGIGEALAYELAKRGAKLILSARSEQELSRVQAHCVSSDKHHIVPLDLEAYKGLEDIATHTWNSFGPIDILINNAGLSQRYLGLEGRLELDEKIMHTNFFGTVALTRPTLRLMLERNQGHIVVVSSVLGLFGIQSRTAYSASKHALRGYFESLRHEVFRSALKITMIYPGYVRTKASNNALTSEKKPHNKLDNSHAKAMSSAACAKKIADAVKRQKSVLVFGGSREILGVYLSRFTPALFRYLAPRIDL